MKIDIKNDVMDKLNAMGINATEQTINSIVQRVNEAVIAKDYYELIEEAIGVEFGLRDVKKTTDQSTSFEDPVKREIQKNLIGGVFWWL